MQRRIAQDHHIRYLADDGPSLAHLQFGMGLVYLNQGLMTGLLGQCLIKSPALRILDRDIPHICESMQSQRHRHTRSTVKGEARILLNGNKLPLIRK